MSKNLFNPRKLQALYFMTPFKQVSSWHVHPSYTVARP